MLYQVRWFQDSSFLQWQWPNSVMLCAVENDGLGFFVWYLGKNPHHRSYVMPIITLGYPCVTSFY
jgi:poly(A) polymerase